MPTHDVVGREAALFIPHFSNPPVVQGRVDYLNKITLLETKLSSVLTIK